MTSNLDILSLAATAAKLPGDPSEVVVVRPKVAPAAWVGMMIGALVAMLIRAGIISLAAANIDFVPDWGYWESFWIGALAVWLFHGNSGWNYWTKGWSERLGAARERLIRKTIKKEA